MNSFLQTRNRDVQRIHGLTPREVEVVRELCSGKTDIEIGEALSISPYTVRAHLTGIFNVTGCHSRIALVGWAHERGLT